MKKYNRREILKSLGVSAAYAGLGLGGFPRMGFGQTPAAGVLVLVFQRGGNDGVNMLAPTADTAEEYKYYAARRPAYDAQTAPKNIGIPRDALLANKLLDRSGSDTGYAINPAMVKLKQIMEANQITFFPATHVAGSGEFVGNMSHFVAQDIMDAGGGGRDFKTIQERLIGENQGWIARTSLIDTGPNTINVYGFASDRSLAGLDGNKFFISATPETGIPLTYGGLYEQTNINNMRQRNSHLSDSKAMGWTAMQERLFEFSHTLEEFVYLPSTYKTTDSPPLNDHEYTYDGPDGVYYHLTEMASKLNKAATLIENLPDLQIVTINQGDYDTHGNQNIRQKALLTDLADNLAAFRSQLSGHTIPVEVVVISEFGRTLDQNANAGTDHGQAFTAMVMGAGGSPAKHRTISYGLVNEIPTNSRPDFAATHFKGGARYYTKTLQDYRNIISEVLQYRLGLDVNTQQTNPFSLADQYYNYRPLGFLT